MTEVQRMQRRLIILQSASDILRDKIHETKEALEEALREERQEQVAREDEAFMELQRRTKPATEIAEDLANRIVNLTMGIFPGEIMKENEND